MGKRISFPTWSLGSDSPPPARQAVAEWIGTRKGKAADLTTYQLESELKPQIEAGLTTPCAGGVFYRERWTSSLIGLEDSAITAEVTCDTVALIRDAMDLDRIQKNLWVAVPAPAGLGLIDRYFHDPEEAGGAVYSAYKQMMRAMRDASIAGHVLLCEEPLKPELESLASKKVFFFSSVQNEKSLAMLLDYQDIVVISPKKMELIGDLIGEYEIRKIVLLDPRQEDLLKALDFEDKDHLICAGYCQRSCPSYWDTLVRNASLIS